MVSTVSWHDDWFLTVCAEWKMKRGKSRLHSLKGASICQVIFAERDWEAHINRFWIWSTHQMLLTVQTKVIPLFSIWIYSLLLLSFALPIKLIRMKIFCSRFTKNLYVLMFSILNVVSNRIKCSWKFVLLQRGRCNSRFVLQFFNKENNHVSTSVCQIKYQNQYRSISISHNNTVTIPIKFMRFCLHFGFVVWYPVLILWQTFLLFLYYLATTLSFWKSRQR